MPDKTILRENEDFSRLDGVHVLVVEESNDSREARRTSPCRQPVAVPALMHPTLLPGPSTTTARCPR